MTLGFDLGFSPRQRMIRDQLHAVARNDLRARAAEAETEGLDLKVVMHHLDTAGIGPATLLEHGIDGYSTLLTAVEELGYGDAGIGWAAVPALQIAVVLNACGTEANARARRRSLRPRRGRARQRAAVRGLRPATQRVRNNGPSQW